MLKHPALKAPVATTLTPLSLVFGSYPPKCVCGQRQTLIGPLWCNATPQCVFMALKFPKSVDGKKAGPWRVNSRRETEPKKGKTQVQAPTARP